MSEWTEQMKEILDSYERSFVRGQNNIKNGYYSEGIENLAKALKGAADICRQSVIQYNGINPYDRETVVTAHLFLARTYTELGDAYCQLGKRHIGIYCYRQAGKVLKAVEESKYPFTATSQAKFKELCAVSGTKLATAEMMLGTELVKGKVHVGKNPKELADFIASEPKDSDKVFDKIKSTRTSFFDYESENKSCFIATAAYSTASHPDLDTFREFRDTKLLNNSAGERFVNWYYKTAPIFTTYIKKNPLLKYILRRMLGYLATLLRYYTLR